MLKIGKRIRQRREALGLSQEELAQKLGYKSRSTINKIEADINDITQSKVSEFARALDTTPAYLMGWEDEKTNAPLDIPPNFPARLRYLREQKGETQEQLAEAMGYGLEDITKWEAGESRPEFKEFSELTRYFDTNLDFLLGRDGQKSKTVVYHHGAAREIKGAEQPLSKKNRELIALLADLNLDDSKVDLLEAMAKEFGKQPK